MSAWTSFNEQGQLYDRHAVMTGISGMGSLSYQEIERHILPVFLKFHAPDCPGCEDSRYRRCSRKPRLGSARVETSQNRTSDDAKAHDLDAFNAVLRVHTICMSAFKLIGYETLKQFLAFGQTPVAGQQFPGYDDDASSFVAASVVGSGALVSPVERLSRSSSML